MIRNPLPICPVYRSIHHIILYTGQIGRGLRIMVTLQVPLSGLLNTQMRLSVRSLLSSLAPLFCARPELLANSRTFKTEGFAQSVLKVALVGEVDRLGIADEEDERGRVDPRLRGVEDLKRFAADNGRVVFPYGVLDDLVELRCRHAQVAHLCDLERCLKDRSNVVARLRRCKNDRCVWDELEVLREPLTVAFGALDLIFGMWKLPCALSAPLLLRQVPLVDDDDDALGVIGDLARDMRVLRGDSLARIYQEQGNIAAIDGARRAQDAVFLDPRRDAPTSTNARCID